MKEKLQDDYDMNGKLLENPPRQKRTVASKPPVKIGEDSFTPNVNKDVCENLRLSGEGRPMWQIRVAKVINGFWFIVWAIISSFTFTPIIVFSKRIGTQVKSAKLTWVLTTIFYLLILFLIFLIIVSI